MCVLPSKHEVLPVPELATHFIFCHFRFWPNSSIYPIFAGCFPNNGNSWPKSEVLMQGYLVICTVVHMVKMNTPRTDGNIMFVWRFSFLCDLLLFRYINFI